MVQIAQIILSINIVQSFEKALNVNEVSSLSTLNSTLRKREQGEQIKLTKLSK